LFKHKDRIQKGKASQHLSRNSPQFDFDVPLTSHKYLISSIFSCNLVGEMEKKNETKSQHATFKAGRTDSWHQLITQSARALWAPQQFLLYFLPHEQEKHTHTHTYT